MESEGAEEVQEQAAGGGDAQRSPSDPDQQAADISAADRDRTLGMRFGHRNVLCGRVGSLDEKRWASAEPIRRTVAACAGLVAFDESES
jgi:hypothetical protein